MGEQDAGVEPRKKLGSLGQSARKGTLKQARGIMIAIGILTILANGFFFFMIPSQIEAEIKKAGPNARINHDVVNQIKIRNQVITGAAVAIGVVFVILGICVYKAPVACTVSALVIYLAAHIIFLIIAGAPEIILQGIIIKIIIVVGLAKAVQAAIAYQRRESMTAESVT